MKSVFADAIGQMNEVNRQAVESALRLNRIAARTQGLLARQQLDVAESCLAAGTRQLRIVSEGRDPEGVVKGSAELIVELGEKLVAAAQESLEIQAQARDEVSQWFEEGVKAVTVVPPAAAPAPTPKPKTTRGARKAA